MSRNRLYYGFRRQQGRSDWVFVVRLLSCVRLFVTPWTAAHQASLSFTISWRLLKLMCIESVMIGTVIQQCGRDQKDMWAHSWTENQKAGCQWKMADWRYPESEPALEPGCFGYGSPGKGQVTTVSWLQVEGNSSCCCDPTWELDLGFEDTQAAEVYRV